jgi:hypothetical protein
LPELVLIEGNQQLAMKPDESFSLSLFTFRSHFATIHYHQYYDFMTARASRLRRHQWNSAAPPLQRPALGESNFRGANSHDAEHAPVAVGLF